MPRTLLASAARTASGTAVLDIPFLTLIKRAIFQLLVTAAATDAGDLLDVYIQHSTDEGTTYDDFVHFTQVLGNGGAKKFIAQWSRDVIPDSEIHTVADAALAAGVIQGPVGGTWRIKWVIVEAGTVNASFTFSLTADMQKG